MRDLPLNGRNIVDLPVLTPGVQSTNTTIKADYAQQQIVVNGGCQMSVNFLLDGAQAVSGGNAFATVDQGGPQNAFNVAADRSLSLAR